MNSRLQSACRGPSFAVKVFYAAMLHHVTYLETLTASCSADAEPGAAFRWRLEHLLEHWQVRYREHVFVKSFLQPMIIQLGMQRHADSMGWTNGIAARWRMSTVLLVHTAWSSLLRQQTSHTAKECLAVFVRRIIKDAFEKFCRAESPESHPGALGSADPGRGPHIHVWAGG